PALKGPLACQTCPPCSRQLSSSHPQVRQSEQRQHLSGVFYQSAELRNGPSLLGTGDPSLACAPALCPPDAMTSWRTNGPGTSSATRGKNEVTKVLLLQP